MTLLPRPQSGEASTSFRLSHLVYIRVIFCLISMPDDGKVYLYTDSEKHKHRAVMHKKNGQICFVKLCGVNCVLLYK